MIFALRPDIAGDLQCCGLKAQIINLFCLLLSPRPPFEKSEAALNRFFLPTSENAAFPPLPCVKPPFTSLAGVSFGSNSDHGRLITLFNVEALCKHVLSCHSFCTYEETEGKHLPSVSSLWLFHASYASPVWVISQQSVKTHRPESQPNANAWLNEMGKWG